MHACIYTCMPVCVCACVCMASKANRAWGHPKRLRRRIQLSTHIYINMYVCEFAWIRLHTRWYVCVCVCVDNSAAGELSKSDQRLHVPMQVLALSMPAHIHTYIHTYSCACVCVCAFHLLCTRCACFFVFCKAIWNVQKIAQQDTYLYGQ